MQWMPIYSHKYILCNHSDACLICTDMQQHKNDTRTPGGYQRRRGIGKTDWRKNPQGHAREIIGYSMASTEMQETKSLKSEVSIEHSRRALSVALLLFICFSFQLKHTASAHI